MNLLHRTWAEIDISALIHNLEIIKKEADGIKIMSVVKANAYGHSAELIAPALDKNGSDAFAVSNIEEAIQLRNYNIKKPILILGYTPVNLAKELYSNNITQCVYSKEYAVLLSEKAQEGNFKVKIHIKLDTGMSRLGFDCRNSELSGIDEAIYSAKLPGLIFEGIFTHFSVSDRNSEEEDGFTDLQYSLFSKGISKFEQEGLNPYLCHCCNSAAFCLDHEKHLDMARPGIILYGLTPSSSLSLPEKFIPVMTLKSVVTLVKTIKRGNTVSYGRTFLADSDIRIATVAVGYADGYPRALSNKGSILIHNKRAKILGRVCMDQMIVDVTDIDDVKMGDEVILFGKELPVEELADICDTINYEIICGISPRVPRVVINKQI